MDNATTQHSKACRHCNKEAIQMNQQTYACALMDQAKTIEIINFIENERMEAVHFLSFICSKCLRVSVFSYLFHLDVCKITQMEPYKDASQYYTSLAVQFSNFQ